MSPRGTYVIPKNGGATADRTFDVAPASDKTIVITGKSKAGKNKVSPVSNIMTDDDSDSEPLRPKIPVNVGSTNKKGQQNELFK